MSIGLLFSGQGAQAVGMGRSLDENSPAARDLFDRAGDVLGWDLRSICFEGPEETLTETKVCQPALFVHGAAAAAALREGDRMNAPAVALGLSLGELTALYAAGVYDFEDGLRLVAERGRLMQEACEATDGGMASVIGGEPDAVEALAREFDIEIANYNCPGQIVVSGEKANVMAAVEEANQRDFKMVKLLNVAGAYHSRLMRPAREAFAEYVRDFEFRAPRRPVYANATGRIAEDPEAIKKTLADQIVSPVQFERCLRNAVAETATRKFFECGPGKILSGLARRTDRSLEVAPVADYSDLPN